MNEQMVKYVVLEHELHVAPAILVVAGFGEVITVEDTAIEWLAGFVSGLCLFVRLEVLDRIEDIEANMDTGGEFADNGRRHGNSSRSWTL